ncbi:hypothetical protein VQL36_02910 [Chengkuizengella sp. SCS-71B]|uniref:hypothetical protein n=1 Tax=Chengkuizengella sp. SCS-71B TaxID=3115290 RepID=UPI0032C24169
MAKSKRGKALWKIPTRSRGTCPICNATRIKLLYDIVNEEGENLKVCKRCQKHKI